MASNAEYKAAVARTNALRSSRQFAQSAHYDVARARIVIQLVRGMEFSFPPNEAEGLDRASVAALSKIEISPSGLGLHWPELDVDLDVPALLQGVLGSKQWASSSAAQLGALGGRIRSSAKRAAAAANGHLGGRPPKRAAMKGAAKKAAAKAAPKKPAAKKKSVTGKRLSLKRA